MQNDLSLGLVLLGDQKAWILRVILRVAQTDQSCGAGDCDPLGMVSYAGYCLAVHHKWVNGM